MLKNKRGMTMETSSQWDRRLDTNPGREKERNRQYNGDDWPVRRGKVNGDDMWMKIFLAGA